MGTEQQFIDSIRKSYQTELPHIRLGSTMLQGKIIGEAEVSIPLCMMKKHGIIAGATS